MIAAAVDALLRRVFADNPWAISRLAPHHGRRIRFAVGGVAGLFVVDREQGLARAPAGDGKADLSVALAAPPALPLGIDTLLRAATIEGPADFAEALSFVLRNLRIEAADWIAPFVGDAAAARLSRTGGALLRAGGDSAGRLADNLREYLVFEAGLLPDAGAAQRFSGELRALGDSLATLERRVADLERQRR